MSASVDPYGMEDENKITKPWMVWWNNFHFNVISDETLH